MDVHLLSRLLKELIIDNDRIALPGMGYFQAEPMPAYFSEDGKTIYPPSKRISFKWDDRASGDMLAAYYTKTYGIDRNTADIELDTFLKQLKPMLHERKFIDFPGVGRLKLTLDGSAYFVTDNTDGGVFSHLRPPANLIRQIYTTLSRSQNRKSQDLLRKTAPPLTKAEAGYGSYCCLSQQP